VESTPPQFSKGNSSYCSNSKAIAHTPAAHLPRTKQAQQSDDRCGTESARAFNGSQKLSALKAYRRAMNLCFKCGEKYRPTHKCAQTVQLQVGEELLEMLEGNESPDSFTTAVDAEEQVFFFFEV
jgi:hypothetical protein